MFDELGLHPLILAFSRKKNTIKKALQTKYGQKDNLPWNMGKENKVLKRHIDLTASIKYKSLANVRWAKVRLANILILYALPAVFGNLQ